MVLFLSPRTTKRQKSGIGETRADTTTLAIGGIVGKVKFRGPDTIEWAYNIVFKKQTGIKEDNVALLKQDEPEFIHKLTGRVWLTSDEGSTSLFKTTFSTDSVVVETFSSNGDLITLTHGGYLPAF